MHFEIIEKDWYKRRAPVKTVKPISVDINEFVKQANLLCDMVVHYEDGSRKTLKSRVIFNKLTQQWTVDGMEVAVRVID